MKTIDFSSARSYEEAYKMPKGGAVAMKGDSLLASVAEILGRKTCLNPKAVYDWAVRQGVNLTKTASEFLHTDDLLLVCVLNDWSPAKGKEMLV